MTRRQDPFKSYRRGAWRRALSHNKLADKALDGIITLQKGINATIQKIEAATPSTLPTDFSTNKVGKIAEWGKLLPATGADFAPNDYRGHGHRQSLVWALLHALHSQELTEEFVHLIDELQEKHDELCDKLDAQGGDLTDTDFASTISVGVLNPDKKMQSRSKATFKTWMISSLSSYDMTNDYINSVIECQQKINSILAALDSGSVTMPGPAKVLNPNAKL